MLHRASCRSRSGQCGHAPVLDAIGHASTAHVVFATSLPAPSAAARVNLAPPRRGRVARRAIASAPQLADGRGSVRPLAVRPRGLDARALPPRDAAPAPARLPARAARHVASSTARRLLAQNPSARRRRGQRAGDRRHGVLPRRRRVRRSRRTTCCRRWSAPAAPPRVWSVGCSDGQELYSVAILLAELNLLDGATCWAPTAAARPSRGARRAYYDAAALQRRSAEHGCESTSSSAIDGRWRIARAVRRRCSGARPTCTRVHEPGAWDLILCRNMAMYLRPDASAKLWRVVRAVTAPGGFLVLGKAERPVGASAAVAAWRRAFTDATGER